MQLSGDDFAGPTGLSGADDLVFSGELLYVTFVDRLLRLESGDSWVTAVVSSSDLEEGGVTGLGLAEGALYGANGQAVEYSLGMEPTIPFWIRRMSTP